MNNKRASFFVSVSLSCLFLLFVCVSAYSEQDVLRKQGQIERSDALFQEQLRRRHKESLKGSTSQIEVESPAPEVDADVPDVCVQIETLAFVGATLLTQSEKNALSDHFSGHCLNMSQINDVVRATTNLYIQRGYVTTRAFVPAQDLGSGVLEIRVIEGAVESIRLNEDTAADRRRIAMAFPSGIVGKPLNLRDIEQGMDQLNRLPSGNAQLRIEPGEKAGASRIVVTDQPGKIWRFKVGLDNSGQKSTGEIKSSVSVDKDNLLGLGDMISLNLSVDAKALLDMSRPGSRNVSGYYTVPFGYWSVTASASVSDYHTHLNGGGAQYVSDGRTSSYALDVNRVLHRGSQSKTSAGVSLSVRDVDNYIEKERLVAASYDLTILGASLDHNRRIFDGVLGVNAEYHLGLPLLGAERDKTSDRDVPKHEFHKLSLTGGWTRPFDIAGQSVWPELV